MRLLISVLLVAQAGWAASLPVPASGVYLGIWVDPKLASGEESATENLEAAAPSGIGHLFALHLIYLHWDQIAAMLSGGVFQPNGDLAGDIEHGRVPVISWGCDQNGPNSNHLIASGDPGEDAIIKATAQALKQYPGPVMLRWFWEFNQLNKNQSCRGDSGGRPTQQVYNDFIGAWQHIYNVFQSVGATNVIFVWNPGSYSHGGSNDAHGYYPGNAYVDWLAVDTYQSGTTSSFVQDFGLFYSDFSQSQYGGKPLMVGENGAPNFSEYSTEAQATYLQGVLTAIKGNLYPLLKAYDYFDSQGIDTRGDFRSWVLDANGGLAAMATLASSGAFLTGPVVTPVVPAISKVANAEGEAPTIAPNTWVEVKGTGLAPLGDTRIWQSSDFVKNQMPADLDGVSVTVNGKAAFVYYISPTQVNILTPPDPMSGSVQVVVTNNGTSSAAFTAQAQLISPSFFVFSDGKHIAAEHANGSFLGPSSLSVPGYSFTPAQPGETVVLYANGFGSTSTPVVSGSSTQSGTLSPAPTVTIGGLTANVTFAGLISPGLFQFNVVVPPNAPGGDQPIIATYNGATTQAGTLLTITGAALPTLGQSLRLPEPQ